MDGHELQRILINVLIYDKHNNCLIENRYTFFKIFKHKKLDKKQHIISL